MVTRRSGGHLGRAGDSTRGAQAEGVKVGAPGASGKLETQGQALAPPPVSESWARQPVLWL